MLPKSKKIKTAEYLPLIKSSYKAETPVLRLSYKKGKTTKFAVTIPKKTAKLAVDRNRLKRLIFQAISEVLPKKEAGFQGIFNAKPGFTQNNVRDVKHLLHKALSAHPFS